MDKLKLKFFSYHLISSLIIIITLSIICQYLWFPAPFLLIDGTWVALLILACVDIVIGPFLTLLLVTSKKSKRELYFDLLIILIIQISALGYGLTQIEQERVWAIVHQDGVFNLVPKKEISKQQLSINQPFPKYNGIYYAMVLNSELTLHHKTSNRPLFYSPERFRPLTKHIVNTIIPYDKLPTEIKVRYKSNFIFKGLAGKQRDAVVVLTSEMKMIDIILLPKH